MPCSTTASQYVVGLLSNGWSAASHTELVRRLRDTAGTCASLRVVWQAAGGCAELLEAERMARTVARTYQRVPAQLHLAWPRA